MAGPPTQNAEAPPYELPPHTPPQSNIAYAPRSTSVPDDSASEFEPTPIHSPGGPQYDDLPPSYDEAREQAVHDARQGIAPLDPNEIEAHRLTLNEGPDEPEVWEYRLRGEQIDPQTENESAPDYGSHVDPPGTNIPIQHVQSTSEIPVGRIDRKPVPSSTAPIDHRAVLLERALEFTRHEPDSDVQYAPRLVRPIALPQQGLPRVSRDGSPETVSFLRAYAKALHSHSIRPAEFTAFLDGLNALSSANNTPSAQALARDDETALLQSYIQGANEAFFAPRGLRVSLRSLSDLLGQLNIPTERGQQAGATATVLDPSSTAERRALGLYPWIEALDANVPEPNSSAIVLQEMALRFNAQQNPPLDRNASSSSTVNTNEEFSDPPHSLPEYSEGQNRNADPWGAGRGGFGGRGRGRHRGGPWTAGRGPGHCHTGPPGFGMAGPRGFGRGGFGRGGHGRRSNSQHGNEWQALGENLGKWGEEFGKRMGDWGMQFGKQAEVMGRDFGRRAETWGDSVSGRASGSGTQPRSSRDQTRTQTDELPPSYSQGPVGQETGVAYGNEKAEVGTTAQTQSPTQGKGKEKATKQAKKGDDDDDDDSSISSDSDLDSESDADSDSDDEEDLPDTSAIFHKRVQSINKQADLAASKGKKTAEEIAEERALAIEKAQNEKSVMDHKIEHKKSWRAVRSGFRQRTRDLRKAHRQRKWEIILKYREANGDANAKGKGKGKGSVKKSAEWKAARKDYRAQRKEIRKEWKAARKDWRSGRQERNSERKKLKKGRGSVDGVSQADEMVWLVIENLD